MSDFARPCRVDGSIGLRLSRIRVARVVFASREWGGIRTSVVRIESRGTSAIDGLDRDRFNSRIPLENGSPAFAPHVIGHPPVRRRSPGATGWAARPQRWTSAAPTRSSRYGSRRPRRFPRARRSTDPALDAGEDRSPRTARGRRLPRSPRVIRPSLLRSMCGRPRHRAELPRQRRPARCCILRLRRFLVFARCGGPCLVFSGFPPRAEPDNGDCPIP